MAAAAVILIATSAVGQPSRQMLYKAPTFTVRNTTNVRFRPPPPLSPTATAATAGEQRRR